MYEQGVQVFPKNATKSKQTTTNFLFYNYYSSKKNYLFKGGDATRRLVRNCNPSMFRRNHMPHPWLRPYALSIYPPWPWWWIWWWSLLSASSTVLCTCMCSGIGSSTGCLVCFGREEMNSNIFSATSSAYCSYISKHVKKETSAMAPPSSSMLYKSFKIVHTNQFICSIVEADGEQKWGGTEDETIEEGEVIIFHDREF